MDGIHVTIYSIHGSYGLWLWFMTFYEYVDKNGQFFPWFFPWLEIYKATPEKSPKKTDGVQVLVLPRPRPRPRLSTQIWKKNCDFHYLVAHPTARKWVITPVINGINRVNPLVTGVITHLLSGMSHQVYFKHLQAPSNCKNYEYAHICFVPEPNAGYIQSWAKLQEKTICWLKGDFCTISLRVLRGPLHQHNLLGQVLVPVGHVRRVAIGNWSSIWNDNLFCGFVSK